MGRPQEPLNVKADASAACEKLKNKQFGGLPTHPDLPERVRVITLPAYSPELNPIERLWDIIEDRIRNRIWEEAGDLNWRHQLRSHWKRLFMPSSKDCFSERSCSVTT